MEKKCLSRCFGGPASTAASPPRTTKQPACQFITELVLRCFPGGTTKTPAHQLARWLASIAVPKDQPDVTVDRVEMLWWTYKFFHMAEVCVSPAYKWQQNTSRTTKSVFMLKYWHWLEFEGHFNVTQSKVQAHTGPPTARENTCPLWPKHITFGKSNLKNSQLMSESWFTMWSIRTAVTITQQILSQGATGAVI